MVTSIVELTGCMSIVDSVVEEHPPKSSRARTVALRLRRKQRLQLRAHAGFVRVELERLPVFRDRIGAPFLRGPHAAEIVMRLDRLRTLGDHPLEVVRRALEVAEPQLAQPR